MTQIAGALCPPGGRELETREASESREVVIGITVGEKGARTHTGREEKGQGGVLQGSWAFFQGGGRRGRECGAEVAGVGACGDWAFRYQVASEPQVRGRPD